MTDVTAFGEVDPLPILGPLLFEMLLLLVASASGVLLGLYALLRKSGALATFVVVGGAYSGGAMLGTALLTLFPDAVDVSRSLACAGVLVGLMFPLLMEQVKNWLEAQCARPSPDDARPLLGTPPLSYSTMQSSVLDRRRRVDPGIVSQTFQLRFCFRAWAHLDARKCTPGGT